MPKDKNGKQLKFRASLSMLRKLASRRLHKRMTQRCQLLDDTLLDRPILVLAPHPDDETLGCGGLIASVRAREVPVNVLFVSDGAASHQGFIDEKELQRIRQEEACSACSQLGVSAENLHFLNLPDGQLHAHSETIKTAIEQLMTKHSCDIVLAPHCDDPPPDHQAVYRAAVDVLTYKKEGYLLEYAIWYWHRWPWTSPLAPLRVWRWSAIVRMMLRSRFGRSSLHDFNRICHHGLSETKRAALAHHRTQVVRMQPNWPILADVANGQWLDRLLTDYELFRLTAFHSTPSNSNS